MLEEWPSAILRVVSLFVIAIPQTALGEIGIAITKGKPSPAAPSFTHQIQPILSDKCFHCHGPDGENRLTELRLDTESGITEAFASGNLPESEAWRRILSDDPDEVMPPPGMHKPFRTPERELIQAWAEAGAPWSAHWAFVPPEKTAVPTKYGDHPVDAFVLKKLKGAGLSPQPKATKEKLLRRATFDLHGVPPTIEELDLFLTDSKPGAWGRALDRLLESPKYGERMAVAWLDGARYADTNGYQNDFMRTMWPWRDWVINSFRRNQPFDEFTIEQLAGDLLPNATHEQRLATAFNRNNRTVTEAGSIAEEWLVENVVDRVETTSTVFLGLTMGCARCHDHKFDPVSQDDFYSFFAFFNSVDEIGVYREVRGNVGPIVECLDDAGRAEMNRLVRVIDEAEKRLDSLKPATRIAGTAWRTGTSSSDPVPVSAAVRLATKTFSGIVFDEQVIKPSDRSRPPSLEVCFLGKVACFTGSQRLEYKGLVEPERDQPLTVSAWVKRRGGGAILSKMHDNNAFRGVDWLVLDDGRLAVHMIHRWPDDAIKVITQDPLPAEQWALVTVAYDGTEKSNGLNIYFGADRQELEVKKDTLTGSLHTDQPFRIGRRSSGDDFSGMVGRLRVFNRELATDEIRQLLNRDLLTAPIQGPGSRQSVKLQTWGSGTGKPIRLSDEWVEQYASLAPDAAARRYSEVHSALQSARREVESLREDIPTCMVMKELEEPRPTYVLRRGEYDKPDKDRPAQPSVPSFLGPLPPDGKDRLALAKWIVSRDNPLTARVAVNRLWSQFFGVGIVKSEENLGVQSDPPSHPELLDWLAVDFMDSGWDVQHVIRLIMTSETYQQSTEAPPELYGNDPENRLLARGPRRRLAAEFVRDNALAVSGLLSDKIGGPSVRPYQPEGLWEELAGGAGQDPYKISQGEDLYRRSLYTFKKRTVPHPTLSTFDAPSFEMCTVNRSTTNTPLQALALLNDVTYVEAARNLGQRMLKEGGDDETDRIAFGFRLATSRKPTEEELRMLVGAVDKYRARYGSDAESAAQLLSVGICPVDDSLPRAELAAYASLGSLLLNLDESITVD